MSAAVPDAEPSGARDEQPHARTTPRLPPLTPGLVTPVLGVIVLMLFLYWSWNDGGYARTTWLPGAVFVLGLATLAIIANGGGLPSRPYSLIALLALAAFTLWNSVTMIWADAPGIAWDGTNRTLLYLCVFAFFLAIRLTPRAVVILIGAFTLGVGAIALITFTRATVLGDPLRWYIDGRLAAPSDYSNANTALFLGALWPAIHFASRREVHPLLRGCFLALAAAMAEAAILCQSRASLVAVPIVAAFVFAFSPGRLRLALSLGLVTTAMIISGRALLDVYSVVVDSGDGTEIVRDAGRVGLVSCVVLFAVGTGVGMIDRLVAVPRAVTRAVGAAVIVLLVATTVVGAAAFVDRHGAPWESARTGWQRFKSGQADDYRLPHLTSGVGTNRYDLWRVAVREFRRAPVQGIGSDNYAIPYLVQRSTSREEPLYPHSLPLRLLSQTGLVGTGLYSVFLGAVFLGVWRLRRARRPLEDATAVAALAFAVYWLAHGSVDWLWEIPALGASATALLALSLALADGRPPTTAPRRPVVAGVIVCAAIGAVSLVLPWIAAKETEMAATRWPESPAVAFDRLALARRLNPLSDEPDVFAAVISQRIGDTRRERKAWNRVVERNPWNWYAHLKLALLSAASGRQPAALREISRARDLNPREPILVFVQRRIRDGKPVSATQIDRLFVKRSDTLLRAGGRQPSGRR